jgi:hypothetical protein
LIGSATGAEWVAEQEEEMGRIVQTMIVVAGLAVIAAPAPAQVGEPVRERPAFERGMRGMRAGGPGAMVRNPAASVLAHQAALGLTAEQVRQIEAIQARVERENATRLEQLRAAIGDRPAVDRSSIREMSAEERQQVRAQMRERMEQVRPIREQLRQTNRAAGEEIRALLTDEQHTQLRELRRAERRDRAVRGPRGARQGEWQRRGERSERGDGFRSRRGPERDGR